MRKGLILGHIYRFYATRVALGVWRLDEDEVVHALKVLRLADGQTVEVMDGKGVTGVGRFQIESKSKAIVLDVSEVVHPQDSRTRALMIAALKPGDVDDLVAPLVELGVDRIIVYRQDETSKHRLSDGATERWARLARAAMKQSKRPWEVKMSCYGSLADALEEVTAFDVRWMLSAEAPCDFLTEVARLSSAGGSVVALVGGEKGFSQREESLALAKGFVPIRLGPWILRAKTAGIASANLLGMMPAVVRTNSR
jgi:16S rRNA (uracil1498-N3)-methyltransferase